MASSNIVVNPQYLSKAYDAYKKLMQSLANENEFTNTEMELVYNCQLIGSFVNTMLFHASPSMETKHIKNYPSGEYDKIAEVQDIADDPSVRLAWEKFTLKTDVTITTIKVNNFNTDEWKKENFPFLAALQICNKSNDSTWYQKAIITKNLGVPTICEPYAV